MSSKKDFYEVLGVPRDATAQQIKKAYRAHAMKHHPDRNNGSTEKFKEISEAYQVLSDERKRAEYDNFGHAGAQGGFGGGGFGAGDFGDININDIFEQFFGGGGGSSGPSRGADIGASVSISFEKAAKGTEETISIRKKSACDDCHGSGAAPGSQPITCDMCHGSGRVAMQQGFLSIQQTCPKCHGQGQIISNPCRTCNGSGINNKPSKINIRIPSGVESGDRMRVPGKGDAGANGAPAGDLYVDIVVQAHPVFKREGVDLHCSVPVSFYQACLGGEVEIATLDKLINLKIPKETQSGSLLRVKGAGIDSKKDGRKGDLICHIQVETPVRLTKSQAELLQEFDQSVEASASHSPKHQSFLNKIKSLFNA